LCQPFPTFPLIGPRALSETRTSLPALDIDLTPDGRRWLNLEQDAPRADVVIALVRAGNRAATAPIGWRVMAAACIVRQRSHGYVVSRRHVVHPGPYLLT